jgi:hypothetical protein
MECNLHGKPNLRSAFASNTLPAHVHERMFVSLIWNFSSVLQYSDCILPTWEPMECTHWWKEDQKLCISGINFKTVYLDRRHPSIQWVPESKSKTGKNIHDLICALQTGGIATKWKYCSEISGSITYPSPSCFDSCWLYLSSMMKQERHTCSRDERNCHNYNVGWGNTCLC